MSSNLSGVGLGGTTGASASSSLGSHGGSGSPNIREKNLNEKPLRLQRDVTLLLRRLRLHVWGSRGLCGSSVLPLAKMREKNLDDGPSLLHCGDTGGFAPLARACACAFSREDVERSAELSTASSWFRSFRSIRHQMHAQVGAWPCGTESALTISMTSHSVSTSSVCSTVMTFAKRAAMAGPVATSGGVRPRASFKSRSGGSRPAH